MGPKCCASLYRQDLERILQGGSSCSWMLAGVNKMKKKNSKGQEFISSFTRWAKWVSEGSSPLPSSRMWVLIPSIHDSKASTLSPWDVPTQRNEQIAKGQAKHRVFLNYDIYEMESSWLGTGYKANGSQPSLLFSLGELWFLKTPRIF